MQKVFLDSLPKYKNGTMALRGCIDWNKSIGQYVKFIYDDIEGEIHIISKKGRYLTISYLNKKPFKIHTLNFARCRIGNYIGKKTSSFKIEIGQHFEDDKRNLIVLDRKIIKGTNNRNWKMYKYHCNKCKYSEGWTVEGSLLAGIGCAACSCPPRIVVTGFNDIPSTNPELIKFFQGGIEEAKLYTRNSNTKIFPKCPNCGNINGHKTAIYNIYRHKSIGCHCGDNVSYPNKLMFSILTQLGINFKSEYSSSWTDKKRYDFYFKIGSLEYIIEMDGGFHYEDTAKLTKKSLKNVIENDNYKTKLAEENNINLIRIDAVNSELEYIKNNIEKSELKNILCLQNIDWKKSEEFALSSLVKKACELKAFDNLSTSEIARKLQLHKSTIISYLKKGSKIWEWCNYNPIVTYPNSPQRRKIINSDEATA